MTRSRLQAFQGPLARWLTLNFVLLALVAVGMAVGSVWVVQFTENTLAQVTARSDTARLSTQIRSESLVLTELVRRHTFGLTNEPDLRHEIAAQQARLDRLIQQVINSTTPGDVDESIAISQVRQYLIAFGSQADRVLAAFDREGELGPATQSELMVLVQNYQIPLLRAIRDFEQFEASRVEVARQQARRVIQTTVSTLTVIAVIVLMMAIVMSRQILARLIGPLAEVQTGVEAIRHGRVDKPIQLDRQDEIGRLAGALNTMSAELQRYQEELEKLVKERTAELRQEISERRLVEDKLRQSQALYQSIVSASPDGITIFNLSGIIEFISPAGVKMFGYSAIEEITGRSVLDFISPNESELVATRLREMARGEVLMPIEYRAVKKDGQVFDIEANTEVIRDANGQPTAVISIIRDITERKQVEEALRASEEKYHQLFELGSDAIFLIDNETGQILEVNAAASTMYGYSRDELLQKRNVDLSAEPDKTRQAMQNYQTSIPIRFHRKKDGAALPVEITASHFTWRGRPVHIAAIRDITERVQADETLHQAKDAAEVANRAKSAFLANMSHELRTPLNAILGFAQLMARSPALPPEHRDNLDIITTSGEHLLTLINQVLDLSKIEAGRMAPDKREFDLYRLLADLESMFQLRAADKGLRLIFDRLPDVPQYIYTDEVRLRQILINLLNNAIKFTEVGRVTVRVGINRQASVCQLHFSISDTGPGIAADELASLFEPFTQTQTGQWVQESTGLGLSISQKFVQLLGGQISVESVVGQGSTFKFFIQVDVVEAVQAAGPIFRRVIGVEPNQPRYRLLVVDNSASNRRLLVNLLTAVDPAQHILEIQEAGNGLEAVKIWQEWQPYLIWMDLRMPGLDGYQAAQQIKATAPGQATTIIALTASAFEEERGLVLAAGFDDLVRKPFREAEIFEMLTRHLGLRFIYAEAGADNQVSYLDQEFDIQAWQALPGELLARLEEAVTRINVDAVNRLIDQIHLHDAAVSKALTALTNDFKFGVILTLIQAAKESTNE